MQCKFYPCHFKKQDCTFCWCPFYPCLEEATGGKYHKSKYGKVWDCSNCTFSHLPELSEKLRFRWGKRWWLGRKDGWFDMYILKRSGKKVKWDRDKITNAINKAALSVQHKDDTHTKVEFAEQLALQVEDEVFKTFEDRVPSVEDVQDTVESVLMKNGLHITAKAYILYRQERTELRKLKAQIGVVDELKLSINSVKVLKERYLLKNTNEEVSESIGEMFRRVAKAVGTATKEKGLPTTPEFYEVMSTLKFLPNSPTLFNAGTGQGCLSACFVLPIGDSMEEIMMACYYSAIIQKFGGGVGADYSHLRERNAPIQTTHKKACGPLAVMGVMSEVSNMITQGGKRHGANMGILRVDHPDIYDFITWKSNDKKYSNFNISVAATDDFMHAVVRNNNFNLISPRTKQVVKVVSARELFNKIVENAWATGDPGLIFIDEINRLHTINKKIESTNPCGEQPLLPFESCNLGSINLEKFVKANSMFDWTELERVVKTAVVFLDNVITINKFPEINIDGKVIKWIEEETKQNRKIGLGVMGFANTLIRLGIKYGSEEGVKFAEDVMEFITETAKKQSEELGRIRGCFPNIKNSVFKNNMRNATVTTIAPTGSISIIANGTSSGIEPLFALLYRRRTGFSEWYEINPLFEEMLKKYNIYTEELIRKVSGKSSIQDVEEIPEELRKVFVTSHDIPPEAHIRMQLAFQKYTDNAVSKTINLLSTATKDDVYNAFIMAWKGGAKGITIYRDMSLPNQPLQVEAVSNPFSAAKCDIKGESCD